MIGGIRRIQKLALRRAAGHSPRRDRGPHPEAAYGDLPVVLTSLGPFQRITELGLEQHISSATLESLLCKSFLMTPRGNIQIIYRACHSVMFYQRHPMARARWSLQ